MNTYTTETTDIIESRTSRAAADRPGVPARGFSSRTRSRAALARRWNVPPAPTPSRPPRAKVAHAPSGGQTPRGAGGATAALGTTSAAASATDPDDHDHEEQLCRVADDAESEARLAALRVLRARLGRPRVQLLADKLRKDLWGPSEHAVLAAGALGELRDAQAVPALIEALDGPPSVSRTANRSLVEITQQDFGQSLKKWSAWWEEHKGTDRVSWLIEGLSHRAPEIRFSSSEELRAHHGRVLPRYHFDLPKREREEARARWHGVVDPERGRASPRTVDQAPAAAWPIRTPTLALEDV